MMFDRIKALETASIFEPHTYCHILGRPRLTRARDGHIQARTNFHVARTMQDGRSESFAVRGLSGRAACLPCRLPPELSQGSRAGRLEAHAGLVQAARRGVSRGSQHAHKPFGAFFDGAESLVLIEIGI